MRVYWIPPDSSQVCLCAEAPVGAMCMELGPMADRDDRILGINWRHKFYETRELGRVPFPEKYYRFTDLVWKVHRVGSKIYPGHEKEAAAKEGEFDGCECPSHKDQNGNVTVRPKEKADPVSESRPIWSGYCEICGRPGSLCSGIHDVT